MVGCAFVQYSNVAEASKAIKELNGKPFLQRPVAIDWAVSKDRFQSENPKPAQPEPEIKENCQIPRILRSPRWFHVKNPNLLL